MMTAWIRTFLTMAAAAAILAGCSHPTLVDMGRTEAEVTAYLGEPHAKTPMPDGTVRWTYSCEPAAQEVWWLFFRDGRLASREQAMQEKYFSAIRPGAWTEKDVWAYWGRCAEEYEFRIVGEHAWMYRFEDEGGFDMAVWPQFDKNGVVVSCEVTEDPWKDRRLLFFPF